MTVPRAGRAALLFGALFVLPVAISPALAQNPPPQAGAPPGGGPAAARMQQLHQMLRITPAQEADFNAFVTAFRGYEATLRSVVQQRPASANTNAVESMRFGQKFAAAQAEGLRQLIGPFARLYAALSPAQKETANRIFLQRQRTPGRG